MSSWANSKSVTNQCWKLLRENRYFVVFPLIAFGVGVLLVLVIGAPAVLLLATDTQQGAPWWIGVALIAVMLYLMAFFAQFSMAALVASTDEELHNRNSSVGAGYGRARKRIGAIAAWAGLSALFNVIMSFIQDKGGVAGNIASAVAGVAWRLVTFFVLPFIVLEEEGAVTGIKDSAKLFKKRWGMRLSGGVRIGGIIGLLVVLPAIIVMIIGLVISFGGVAAVGVPIVVIGIIVLFGGMLLLSTLRVIFSVALFRYAGDDQALGGFSPEELQAAVTPKA